MAQSTCVKCGGTRFEMKDAGLIAGTGLRWFFIQCASCGGVVGVVDYYPHRTLLDNLEAIGNKLDARPDASAANDENQSPSSGDR